MNIKCLWRSQSPSCKAQCAKQLMWGDFVTKPRRCKWTEGTKDGRVHGTPSLIFNKYCSCLERAAQCLLPWLPTGPGGLDSHAGWEQWLLRWAYHHLEVIKPLWETFYASPVNGAHVSRSFPGFELRGHIGMWNGHFHVDVSWQLQPQAELSLLSSPCLDVGCPALVSPPFCFSLSLSLIRLWFFCDCPPEQFATLFLFFSFPSFFSKFF